MSPWKANTYQKRLENGWKTDQEMQSGTAAKKCVTLIASLLRTVKKEDSHPLEKISLKYICLKICISWWHLTAAAGAGSSMGENCN